MASSEKQCGVTPPISSELPTEAEKRSSEKLLEELRRQGTFEPASETQRRSVGCIPQPAPGATR